MLRNRSTERSSTLSRVPMRPLFDVGDTGLKICDVSIPAAYIAQIVVVRAFIQIADTIFRNHGAIAMAEAVNGGCADAAAGIASSDDDRIDPLLGEVVGDSGLEEDRWALLADLEVVLRVINSRIEIRSRVVVTQKIVHSRDLPVRHLTLVHVRCIAIATGTFARRATS